MDNIGRLVVIIGIGLIVVGGVIMLLGRIPALRNLPTLEFKIGENITCIVPIAASIILSVILTIVLNLVVRMLNR